MKLEYLVAFVLVALLVLLGNPFMFWMPSMLATAVLLSTAVLALIYAGFVLKETSRDEREMLHRMFAGRAAYLTGISVLTLALLYEGLTRGIDPWIPATLACMVIAKVVAHAFAERTK